jgi:hypothetical protein
MCRNCIDIKQFCGGISVMSGAVSTITNGTIIGNKSDKSANCDGGGKAFKYMQRYRDVYKK